MDSFPTCKLSNFSINKLNDKQQLAFDSADYRLVLSCKNGKFHSYRISTSLKQVRI